LANVTNLVNAINNSNKIKIIHVFSQGPVKLGCIIHFVKYKFNVKLDIFAASAHDYMYQLLFTTGSAKFNIFTRAIAKRRGYLLNQHGLYENGNLLPITNEKKLFKFLKIKYLQPHER
jgi:DNA polymerase/3'-5' exonuclease PolX